MSDHGTIIWITESKALVFNFCKRSQKIFAFDVEHLLILSVIQSHHFYSYFLCLNKAKDKGRTENNR